MKNRRRQAKSRWTDLLRPSTYTRTVGRRTDNTPERNHPHGGGTPGDGRNPLLTLLGLPRNRYFRAVRYALIAALAYAIITHFLNGG